MRNTILTFADRLRYLMQRDSIKNAPQLAAAMYDAGIIIYPADANETRRKECRASATRTIDLHLAGKPIENISGEWIARYSKFFHCSTDYLFGNISMPTPDVATVHDLTGLSESAIANLHSWHTTNDDAINCYPSYISDILEDDDATNLLHNLNTYSGTTKLSKFDFDEHGHAPGTNEWIKDKNIACLWQVSRIFSNIVERLFG